MRARTSGVAIAAVLLAVAPMARAQPVGTAFTYQGGLSDAGNPANGAYDLQLAAFDAASAGGQVGPTLTRDDVVVTNGLFTVTVDFGSVFTGSKRWLEIRVRPGASTGAYTVLSPRMELSPAPHSVSAQAVPWSGVAGKPAGFADDVDNDSGGDITGVNAGTGLTGGGTAGAVSLAANLGGSGSATTIARTDHDHLNQTWTIPGLAIGLRVQTGMLGLQGLSTATSGGAGVWGEAVSTNGLGVAGFATSTTGGGIGVGGNSASTAGFGVYGYAPATAGPTRGVYGEVFSTGGVGVYGQANPTTGAGVGVWGRGSSTGGYGGYFENASGGPAIGLSAGGIRFSDGTLQTTAPVASSGDITSVAAGAGLTGGGASGAVTLSADLAGSGAASTVARSDHNHLGQVWNGPADGLRVESTGALGLTGVSLATTGFARGVIGESSSSQGTGVLGNNQTPDGRGTTGFAGATTGSGIGVYAVTNGPTGIGLSATAQSPTGQAHGVLGAAFSTEGTGVRGTALAASGFANGVWGRTNSAAGFGGVFENAGGGPAIRVSNGGIRFGDGTTQTTAAAGGDITGVLTPAGSGLTGGATAGDAALAVSFGGSGTATAASRTDHHHLLQSWSGTNSGSATFRVTNTGSGGFTDGIWGQSNAAGGGRGVVGYAPATSARSYGVWGQSDSFQGLGVIGVNTAFGTGVEGQGDVGVNGVATTAGLLGQTTFDAPAGAVGVLGDATSLNTPAYAFYGIGNSAASYAGWFAGRVHVTGTLSKGGGAFKIDHPLDPENKYLYHSFVESPDMKNIYDGNVTTDGEGLATVELPEWFEALNRDFRYQLTVIGQFAQAIVATRIADNRFTIRTDKPGVDVSWQVTGIRKDAFAEKNRIPVEEAKSADERGTYLHPDAWGQPPEAGLDHERQRRMPLRRP